MVMLDLIPNIARGSHFTLALKQKLFLSGDITECLIDDLPCVNGGTCQGSGETLTCNCLDGYKGDFCQCKEKSFFQFVNVVVTRGSLSRNVRHPLRRCNVRYQAFFIKM